jgi:hypothetical protein
VLRHLAFLFVFSFSFLSQLHVVVLQIPLLERSGIDSDDTVLHQGFGSNQLVVGGIVNNIDNFGFFGDSLRCPVKVTFVKSQGSIFVVATSDTDFSNSLVTQFGVGRDTSEFELSLLLMDGHASTSGSSFMSRITRNSHSYFLIKIYKFHNLQIKYPIL